MQKGLPTRLRALRGAAGYWQKGSSVCDMRRLFSTCRVKWYNSGKVNFKGEENGS
jgi:hypothetical protein